MAESHNEPKITPIRSEEEQLAFIKQENIKFQQEGVKDMTPFLQALFSDEALNDDTKKLIESVLRTYVNDNNVANAIVTIDQGQAFRDVIATRAQAFNEALDQGAFDAPGKLNELEEKMKNSIKGVNSQLKELGAHRLSEDKQEALMDTDDAELSAKDRAIKNLLLERREEQAFVERIHEREQGHGKSHETQAVTQEQAAAPVQAVEAATAKEPESAVKENNLLGIGAAALGVVAAGTPLAAVANATQYLGKEEQANLQAVGQTALSTAQNVYQAEETATQIKQTASNLVTSMDNFVSQATSPENLQAGANVLSALTPGGSLNAFAALAGNEDFLKAVQGFKGNSSYEIADLARDNSAQLPSQQNAGAEQGQLAANQNSAIAENQAGR